MKKNNIEKKVIKKIIKIAITLLKPFIPYILLFLFIYFFIILIIDAIFVEFTDKDGNVKYDEKELEEYCETATTDNYEVYVDGTKVNNTDVAIDSTEKQKSVTAEQIYSLMIFHNITADEPITEELINNIASNFASKYYYKTSTILKERKTTDEDGNIIWEKESEETIKLMTESITIAGNYKYNYVEEIKEERRYKDN